MFNLHTPRGLEGGGGSLSASHSFWNITKKLQLFRISPSQVQTCSKGEPPVTHSSRSFFFFSNQLLLLGKRFHSYTSHKRERWASRNLSGADGFHAILPVKESLRVVSLHEEPRGKKRSLCKLPDA